MKVKASLFLLLFSLLLSSTAYASYWSPGLTISNAVSDTEAQINWLTIATADATGLGKVLSDVISKPASAVYGFFSSINNWVGEFVLLLRIFFWIAVLVLIQVLAVTFWVIIVKSLIKLAMIYQLATDPVNTIRSINKDFHRKTVTTADKLQAILTIFKPGKSQS
jgi:hypothetical protein